MHSVMHYVMHYAMHPQRETLLLSLGDFYAKMLASVVLMQGTSASADSYFRHQSL